MNENKPRRRANAARAAQKSAYRKSGLSRLVLMVTMMALVAVVSIGGTLAWLQASTTEVVNTFKTNDITVDLKESVDTDEDGKETFSIVPGLNIKKDPKVTATSSVDCFVFVEVTPEKWPNATETDGTTKKINYEINDEVWTALGETYPNVYYKKLIVTEGETEVKLEASVLKGDVVTVSSALTKKEMEDITENGEPTLSFKAYAIQAAKGKNDAGDITEFTAVEAWATVSTGN